MLDNARKPNKCYYSSIHQISLTTRKTIEIAFTNRFLPIIELSVGKRYIQQNSLKPSFTIFLAFVDRYFSLSELFVVRDPGVIEVKYHIFLH